MKNKFTASIILTVTVLIFALLNTHAVPIAFGVMTADLAVAIVALLCFGAGLAAGFLPFRNRQGMTRGAPVAVARPDTMNSGPGINLYVGNLADNLTEQDLHTLFEQFGTVQDTKILMDRHTGEPRGFGFVKMDSEASGQAAIEGLSGKVYHGKTLKVNLARHRGEDSRGRARTSRGHRRQHYG